MFFSSCLKQNIILFYCLNIGKFTLEVSWMLGFFTKESLLLKKKLYKNFNKVPMKYHHDNQSYQFSQKNNCLYLKRGLYNAIVASVSRRIRLKSPINF